MRVPGGRSVAVIAWPLVLPSSGYNLVATSLAIVWDVHAAQVFPAMAPRELLVSAQLRWNGRRLRHFHERPELQGYGALCLNSVSWTRDDGVLSAVRIAVLRLAAVSWPDVEGSAP